jgi:hypothetical protein
MRWHLLSAGRGKLVLGLAGARTINYLKKVAACLNARAATFCPIMRA